MPDRTTIPSLPAASRLYELALRHHKAGRLEEADELYQEILNRDPQHADGLHGRGMIARRAGKYQDAIGLIARAIELKPNIAEYHTNLGNALADAGRFVEAAAAHRTALRLRPSSAEALNNLGNALWALGQQGEALKAIQAAVAIYPLAAESQTNLGNGLREIGRLDDALAAHRLAVQLKPEAPEVHVNLGNTLALRGELDEAIACYRRAIALNPASASLHSHLLLTLSYSHSHDRRAISEELLRWNERHAEPLFRNVRPHHNDRNTERRLRIGYVSSFFCSHVCAVFIEPLLANHDPQQVEIVCYSNVMRPDATTERLRSLASLWRDTAGIPDEQLADRIRNDAIDILVDLHLHTADNRLLVFARKPAPVQVTWLGYPGSTGMRAIDYRLTDAHLDPPGLNDAFHTEQSVHLNTFWCYGPTGERPPINPLPALASGHITFGCLNNFCKVNDFTLKLWASVMCGVTGSRLMILSDHGTHCRRAVQVLEKLGIKGSRIDFHGRRSRTDYLKMYSQIDMCLDTFPYTGHTTTCDAIWMGVPVVSLAGEAAVSRGGVSILTNAGAPELVARDPEHFVEIATNLARDPSRLSQYRRMLRKRLESSPVMDGPNFVQQIERAYRDMWKRWCG